MPSPRPLKLHALIQLRWWTLGAQVVMALTIQWLLGLGFEWGSLGALMGIQAASNGCAKWCTPKVPTQREDLVIVGLLSLDILLLTGLLYFTGGPLNPFGLLYIAHVSLAAVVLPVMGASLLTVVACLAYATLFILEPGGSHAHHDPVMLRLHLEGMWYALMITATLVVFFIARIKHALEHREAQLALARQSRDEQNRLASLAMLSAVAAHELSTPLSTIALIAKELMLELQQQGAPQVHIEDAQVMRQQVDACHAILQQMASDAGQSLGEMSTHVSLEQMAHDVHTRHPALHIDIHEPAVELLLPRYALVHMLSGLVRNAYEAHATHVTLRAHRCAQDSACILIIDDGVGMTPEALIQAMTPFHSTKSNTSNLGLGLYLARNLSDRLGGTLDLASSPDTGTTLTLTLPLNPTYMEDPS